MKDPFIDYRFAREDRKVAHPKTPAGWADAYIFFRRSLGFKTVELEKVLRQLLVFMQKRGLASFDRIDRKLASEWLYQGSPQELTILVRLATIRGFFRYLVSLGALDASPWDAFNYPKPKRFMPFVFPVDEIKRLFGYLRGRAGRAGPKSDLYFAYYALFHTIYACGLRAQEGCKLNIGDTDFGSSIFTVRETKFGKSRLVPFNARTGQIVREYLECYRPSEDGMPQDAPLFLNLIRKRFRPKLISGHFSKVCSELGIGQGKQVRGSMVYGGATLHSLRHSFAVHRLLKWYEEGADVNAKLPLLSTYMGHVHYKHTQRYLTVLPVFIDMAGKMLAGEFETTLKDIE